MITRLSFTSGIQGSLVAPLNAHKTNAFKAISDQAFEKIAETYANGDSSHLVSFFKKKNPPKNMNEFTRPDPDSIPSPIQMVGLKKNTENETILTPLLNDGLKASSDSHSLTPKTNSFFHRINPFASDSKEAPLLAINFNKIMNPRVYTDFLKDYMITPPDLYRFIPDLLKRKKEDINREAKIPQMSPEELDEDMQAFWKTLKNDQAPSKEEPTVSSSIREDFVRSRSYIINKTMRYSNRANHPKDTVSEIRAKIAQDLSSQVADHLLQLNTQGRFAGYIGHLRGFFPSYHFTQGEDDYGFQYSINTHENPPSTTIIGTFKAYQVDDSGSHTIGYIPVKIKTDLVTPIQTDPNQFRYAVHSEIFPLTKDASTLKKWFEEHDLTK